MYNLYSIPWLYCITVSSLALWLFFSYFKIFCLLRFYAKSPLLPPASLFTFTPPFFSLNPHDSFPLHHKDIIELFPEMVISLTQNGIVGKVKMIWGIVRTAKSSWTPIKSIMELTWATYFFLFFPPYFFITSCLP